MKILLRKYIEKVSFQISPPRSLSCSFKILAMGGKLQISTPCTYILQKRQQNEYLINNNAKKQCNGIFKKRYRFTSNKSFHTNTGSFHVFLKITVGTFL